MGWSLGRKKKSGRMVSCSIDVEVCEGRWKEVGGCL
jgi:hypothetical protein